MILLGEPRTGRPYDSYLAYKKKCYCSCEQFAVYKGGSGFHLCPFRFMGRGMWRDSCHGVAKNSSSIMSMDVGSGADKRGHRLLRWPRRSSCRITKVRFGCPIGLSKRRTLIPSRTTSAQLLMVAGVTRLKLSRARAAFAVCRIYSMRSARWLIH